MSEKDDSKPSFFDVIGFLYETHPGTTDPTSWRFIDTEYAPEKGKFEPWTWVKVGHFEPEGDGHPVDIHEIRGPAKFFKLIVHPWPNSVGEPQPGFALSTGSGSRMGRLMFQLAREIARGMVDLCEEGEE